MNVSAQGLQLTIAQPDSKAPRFQRLSLANDASLVIALKALGISVTYLPALQRPFDMSLRLLLPMAKNKAPSRSPSTIHIFSTHSNKLLNFFSASWRVSSTCGQGY